MGDTKRFLANIVINIPQATPSLPLRAGEFGIFKVSSIDFIFGHVFAPGLDGNDFQEEVMHRPESFQRR
ncbi:MAG: hypothetical protein M0R70_16460 [Nitrospirae bacterium]|nr:hypothetical protein [Nitrospirota bacterium]